MKHLRLFEDFGTHMSPARLADEIESAVGGFGTDEERFARLVTSLRDQAELAELNRIMSSNPDKFTYPTLAAAIENELGPDDEEARIKIERHLQIISPSTPIPVAAPVQTYSKQSSQQPIISNIIDRVIQHEGKRDMAYLDSKGIPTVGVGFNLNNQDAVARLKQVGANPVKIKAGKAKLTDSQIKTLLIDDLERALVDAKSVISNFDKLPQAVQGVLVEMAFNLGRTRLGEFKRFLSKLSMGKWADAAAEMLRSDWKKQVGQRAVTLANLIKAS
jgi:lysozyme